MKIKATVAALTLTALSFSSQAAWTVSNGWCSSMTRDGAFMVRVKQTSVGIIDMRPDCAGYSPTARTAVGLFVNNDAHQAMAVCIEQTGYKIVVTLPDTSDVNAINASLKETSGDARIQILDRASTLNMTGFNETCGPLIATPAAQRNLLQDEANNQAEAMRKMGYEPDGQGGWKKKSKQPAGPSVVTDSGKSFTYSGDAQPGAGLPKYNFPDRNPQAGN